jgi:predicted RNA-binding Zn-ribbon protein involved in translation (DUF1610 family)
MPEISPNFPEKILKNPGNTPETTQEPENSVPCPFCGQKMVYSEDANLFCRSTNSYYLICDNPGCAFVGLAEDSGKILMPKIRKVF